MDDVKWRTIPLDQIDWYSNTIAKAAARALLTKEAK
jgi:hypothetical protein